MLDTHISAARSPMSVKIHLKKSVSRGPRFRGLLRRKERTLPSRSHQARSTETQTNEARARADASFSKEERAKDGAKAMTEYLDNARLVRERTERLRALRLAKEAADRKAAEKQAATATIAAVARKRAAAKA
jgi:hypothetical protein